MGGKCINVHDPESPVYELTDDYDGRRAVRTSSFEKLNSGSSGC